ncbi:hypothetical protein MMC30_001357 [Trapelia coarctata]|nr:hypothetical protein [Trapelia coarctata]
MSGLSRFLEGLRPGAPLEDALNRWCYCRVFATMEQQRIGMLPEGTAKGDILGGFAGANTPFAIRPNGEEFYRLIGEAYVHGFMNGEILLFPGFDDGLEDIRLR